MASTIAAVGLAPALHRPVAPQPPPPAPAPSPERAAPEQVTPHPSYRPAPQVESYAPPAADPHEETDPSGKARNRGTSPADAMRAIEESTGRPAPRPVPPPPPDFHGQAPAPAPLPPPRPAAPPAASPAPEPSGFVASPSVQPPPGFVPRSVALRTPDPQRQIDDARRFARLLVNEIKLYNERKVQEGKAAGTLYETLKDDIERSRQAYAERVPESIRATTDFFHEELVRILADGRPEALGPAGS